MIKEATASTFVWCEIGGRWRLGLIEHPRLKLAMLAGGHVEADESPAEAAVREAREETGRDVRLLSWPSLALPSGYPYPAVAQPWWTNELLVPADNHVDEPHVHIDHQFLAVAHGAEQVSQPAHPFGWYSAEDLDRIDMVSDTRMLARMLFPMIADIIAAAESGPADLLRVISGVGVR
ncbi:NUDIX domain-containing protein [Nocardia sp. NPDC050710]|uniref:NUDIX hydrolase n=1 Tax=Nocardia sp. NPDC050710 TaxID=3157220 RepID=UPI0033C6192F